MLRSSQCEETPRPPDRGAAGESPKTTDEIIARIREIDAALIRTLIGGKPGPK